tara:strand:- start:1095 stop:1478 length:384 start_codon:yes stop_codon:yes gene_type:complete
MNIRRNIPAANADDEWSIPYLPPAIETCAEAMFMAASDLKEVQRRAGDEEGHVSSMRLLRAYSYLQIAGERCGIPEITQAAKELKENPRYQRCRGTRTPELLEACSAVFHATIDQAISQMRARHGRL